MPIRCCIHQPEHLSYPGFWVKLLLSDVWVAFDTAQYQKSHYHNRNKIAGPSGWQWLTVPVIVPNHKSPISSVVIADEFNPSRHIATVTHTYRSAPSFHRIHAILNYAFQRASKHRSLEMLNLELTESIATYLGIHLTIIRASTLIRAQALEIVEPTKDKNQRLINICHAVSADTYVCGSGSEKYMDNEKFIQSGIAVEQVGYIPNPYPRPEPFQPNLSIIDLLMCSPDNKTVVNYLKSSFTTRTIPDPCLTK